mmetsp:Transcript_8445/g.35289  ORF Transcript_8445/g.35289 Transcript_8445/m.35289 type:complete len:197 (+) Transcript_8445:44-634(+)
MGAFLAVLESDSSKGGVGHGVGASHSAPVVPQRAGGGYQVSAADVEGVYNSLPEETRDQVTDYVQDRVGQAVAGAARDEATQRRAGEAVSGFARNEEYQKQLGATIAAQSGNQYVAAVAQNEYLQRQMGSAVGAVASNEALQRAAGNAVARAAEDKELQKKVASTVWEGTKKSGSLLGDGASLAFNAYVDQQAQPK